MMTSADILMIVQQEFIYQYAELLYWQEKHKKEKHSYLELLVARAQSRVFSLSVLCKRLFSDEEILAMKNQAHEINIHNIDT